MEFTKKIYETGIDAVILITGHFAKVGDNDETLMINFEKMLNLTNNIPLGLYECPAPYKRILSANVFEKLIATNRFVYHKDTSIEKEQVKAKLELLKNKNNSIFEFYDAHTPNATFSIQNGARGMSSISGNFYPEIMVWLCNNIDDESKKELVNWLQQELIQVDPLIHIAYPMSAKYFLQKRGLPVRTISRATAFELTPDQKIVLDNIYEKFLIWCNKLNIKPISIN